MHPQILCVAPVWDLALLTVVDEDSKPHPIFWNGLKVNDAAHSAVIALSSNHKSVLVSLFDQAVSLSDGLKGLVDRWTPIRLIGYATPSQPQVTLWRLEDEAVAAGGGGLVLELAAITSNETNKCDESLLPSAKLTGVSGGPAVLPNGQVGKICL